MASFFQLGANMGGLGVWHGGFDMIGHLFYDTAVFLEFFLIVWKGHCFGLVDCWERVGLRYAGKSRACHDQAKDCNRYPYGKAIKDGITQGESGENEKHGKAD